MTADTIPEKDENHPRSRQGGGHLRLVKSSGPSRVVFGKPLPEIPHHQVPPLRPDGPLTLIVSGELRTGDEPPATDIVELLEQVQRIGSESPE